MFDIYTLSPVEQHCPRGYLYPIGVKRNDLFVLNNEVNGSKVCGAGYLIQKEMSIRNIKGVITIGSRTSPQCNIVSVICEILGIEAHLFFPNSKTLSDVQKLILTRKHSHIHNDTGQRYHSILNKRAKEFADKHPEYLFLPFGLESDEVSDLLSKQCQNIPAEVEHITITIGGGNNFVAILKGLYKYRPDIKVTGIIVGSENSKKYIYNHTPYHILNRIDFDIKTYRPDLIPIKRYLKQEYKYLGSIKLNETYEAKCGDFIRGDLGTKELFGIIGG